jgi:hypothetical protein
MGNLVIIMVVELAIKSESGKKRELNSMGAIIKFALERAKQEVESLSRCD